MSESSATACPVCGSDGVKACDTPDQSDHEGRPPFFDARAEAALRSMARRSRVEP